jgi:hypothetical protein
MSSESIGGATGPAARVEGAAPGGPAAGPPAFCREAEEDAIFAWLRDRRGRWPRELWPDHVERLDRVFDRLYLEFDNTLA